MPGIRRREFIKTVASGSIGAALSGVAVAQNAGHDKRERPNIIFLLTDDQRWDSLGCMGNPIIKTPNIDDMAADGVLFKNAYVTTPICCSSRASILIGQYSRRHGIHDFDTNFTEQALAETYPMLLRNAGYRTGFVGKYGITNTDETMPKDRFDVWKGFTGQIFYEHEDADGNPRHLTSMLGEQSIDFLRGCSDDQPFCLSVGFKAPHVEHFDPRQFIPDPDFMDLYEDDTIPLPETADQRYFDALPEFLKTNSEARIRWKIRFGTPEMYQRSVKNYYRLISGVDKVIGDIRNELDRQGFAENTVIIFMGDNGFYLGEHGLAGKWYGHEESIRVPLIIYDPRMKSDMKGRVSSDIALNIDIAPTILALAGLAIPDGVNGRNLYDRLYGAKLTWRRDFLFEHLFEYDTIQKSEGVVSLRYKYMRYIEQNPVYEELYDLKDDPHETRNLAGEKSYLTMLAGMRKRCDELIEGVK
ncbi:sulfatase [Candidatus Latescibacterota bacterium]